MCFIYPPCFLFLLFSVQLLMELKDKREHTYVNYLHLDSPGGEDYRKLNRWLAMIS